MPRKKVTPPAGADGLPDDIRQDLERVMSGFEATKQVVSRDAEMAMISSFQSGVEYQGKMLPEFIPMYKKNGRRFMAHAKRIMELMIKKGFTLKPPPDSVYEELWFHWRCPVPGCRDRSDICELHGEPGTDSDHALHSPDFMVLSHLQSGNQIHRAFYEINKKRLQEEMSDAFTALLAMQEEEERRSERLHEAEVTGLRGKTQERREE